MLLGLKAIVLLVEIKTLENDKTKLMCG